LRHLKGQFAYAGEQGLGLEAVGVVTASGCALVGGGAEERRAFDLGGLIDEDTQGFAGAIKTVLKQHGISFFQRVDFDTHGHDRLSPFLMSWHHATAAPLFRAVAPGATRPRRPPGKHSCQRRKTEFTERTIHNSETI
jgi:hypothetical protein